ncbi:MAG TPA: GNAT family protein [Bryobacteraceae bacterium]|nr:GNAT family protein [Bryobacteraceae bacterium]
MERGLTGSRELVTIRVDDEIELRPVSPADCDELYAAIDRNRERLRAWLPWVGLNFQPKDLLAHLEQRERDNVARTSLTTHIHFQGRLCGAIGLHAFDLRHRSTSVGYWLDHLWEGHGVMTRACRAIVTEGFHHYGLHRIEIRCGTGNVRSLAIPRRLGFIEEGILREAEWVSNRWVDLRVFAMLEQDWRSDGNPLHAS